MLCATVRDVGQPLAVFKLVKFRVSLLLLLAALTLTASDQDPVAPSRKLTLEEALATARKNSPAILNAAAITARADAGVRTSLAYSNPLIEVFQGKQSARPVPSPGAPGLLQHYAAYQTIEIPKERTARRRVAELATTSSRFGSQVAQLGLNLQVKRAFYEALRQKQEIDHAEANLRLVEDLRRRVQVEVNEGEKGRLELTRAEAELARARFAVQSAKIGVANAIAMLRLAMAVPVETNLDPEGELSGPVSLGTLAALRDRVTATNPLVAQARTDVSQAEAVLEHQRTLRLPQPTLFAEFEQQPDLSFWRLGATIPIPVRDRRQGQIGEATALIRQAKAALQQRELELYAALEKAYEEYQLADQQVTSLESGSLREAESAVNAAQAAYRFGERGIVEVLDAQRVLQTVRGDLLDAQYRRQGALTDLEELGVLSAGGKP